MDKVPSASETSASSEFPAMLVADAGHVSTVAESECAPLQVDPPWRDLDRLVQSALVRATGGISPFGLYLDCLDWVMHLAASPGKQMSVLNMALLPLAEAQQALGYERLGKDPRFKSPDWDRVPFYQFRDAFQRMEICWQAAASGVSGATPKHQSVVRFLGRQILDVFSPSNLWWANPEVLDTLRRTGGMSMVLGALRMQADIGDLMVGSAPGAAEQKRKHLRVGKDLAVTPGSIVFANALMELIRYEPRTTQTFPEPILVVPSWLLKFYILDLSPRDSLVRYLVEAGHTVYMISWKNPREEGRDWGMSTYLDQGLLTALRHINRETGGRRVHTVGYCLGGTLLAIGAAALGRLHARRPLIKTVTLLAAQTDFSEPGELGLFVSSSGVSCLDALMWRQGFIDGKQLAGVFQILNSRDLIWSRLVHDYLLGRQLQPTDLMAWNADTTRLPYRLHSEVMHGLYLNNNLAEGRQCVGGELVTLTDIHVPMMVVATEKDHISPWRSVHKMHLLTHREMTFLLCSGGHNVGIVSPPGSAMPNRHFRWKVRHLGDSYLPPDDWMEAAELDEGSWWPHWQAWLARHSNTKTAAPKYPPGRILGEAPGTYVLEH